MCLVNYLYVIWSPDLFTKSPDKCIAYIYRVHDAMQPNNVSRVLESKATPLHHRYSTMLKSGCEKLPTQLFLFYRPTNNVCIF